LARRACKALYTGSIPVAASNKRQISRTARGTLTDSALAAGPSVPTADFPAAWRDEIPISALPIAELAVILVDIRPQVPPVRV